MECILCTYPSHPNYIDICYAVNRDLIDSVNFSPTFHTKTSYSVIKVEIIGSKLINVMYKEQSSEREQEE